MFVEKLSLFGFKSFNQKVSLDFGPGISGVIGPNGCGKSNIVDAMRWVLGEQSTKQLRGGKMEDVIFNGTSTEKAMSLAQIELTINNDRGVLPLDYSTITVGRRLYRSGQSEYYINKNTVRLKDVRELFLDTGMGSHAYSVIERQMVDNILSDTTGHRRFLFEEAAGIMRYKSRKKETLSKLEATERDLLRVNDIITEVERQVNSLKRQVGKARRYRELMEEIRSLDLALSQIQRRSWLNAIGILDEEYRRTLRTADEAETEMSTLEAHLEQVHLEVLAEEDRLREARELLARTDDALGQGNSRTMVLRERLDATRQKIQEAKEHQVRLADRLERNRVSQDEQSERLAGLESREGEERERLEEREKALQVAERAVRELREKSGRAQQMTLGLFEEKVRAEGAMESMRRRLEELDGRIAMVGERLGEARQRRQNHSEALEASEGNVTAAAGRVATLEEELRDLQVERAAHRDRMETLRQDLGRKREEEAAVRSRLETLEALRARYEGFAPGVRALMLEGERSPSVVGTLSDLAQIPGEWVKALEPALSEAWQYVVTADTDSARLLLGQLQSESLGYATLVPLDRVPSVSAPQGDLVWASEVVEAEESHRSLLRYLIGDLALVEDLDEALEVVGSGRARRAATRTGQYVDAAVLAGGQGGPQGAELLEREEGLQRCRLEIDGLVTHLSRLTEQEEVLRREGEDLERRQSELEGSVAEARDAVRALDKERGELALQVRHAADAVREFEEQRSRMVQQRESTAAEQAGVEQALETCLRKSEQADAEHRELAGQLSQAEVGREEVLSVVHQMRLTWARLEGDLKDARTQSQHNTTERETLLHDQERTRREETESEARRIEIEQELEELAEKIRVLHIERDERQQVVAERDRRRADAVAREQQDVDAAREVRRRAQQARQASHEAEVKLTRMRTDLGYLEARLQEEYEVSPTDLDRLEIGEMPEDASERLLEYKDRMRKLGPVNLLAVEEYEEKSTRLEFMTTQRDDLVSAKQSLLKTIDQINQTASGMFLDTFGQVQENFQKTFQTLFQGGECSLTLAGDDPLESDIDVIARPRGKKPQGIHQLSSGERALTAIALLFAIYLVKPSPFCILDEVDAPLDDANIDRFVAMIKEFSRRTQFIVITHNKKTMEAADCLYGVTMQRPGMSSVVSVKLDGDEVAQVVREAAEENTRNRKRAGAGNGSGSGSGNGNGRGRGNEPPASVEDDDGEGDPLSPESAIIQ